MTELTWEGKCDKDGKKVSPVKIALPFQTIETVNESASDREKRLTSLFDNKEDSTWYNRLIWGDKKYVLPSLLPEFAGNVKLIYIDPPFFTGTDQKINVHLHDSEEFIVKEPSIIEEAAYRNVWRDGSDSFCDWIYDTLIILRGLLHESGAIFIRFDQYWSHYVKIIADEVFGKNNFKNDITLKRVYKNFTNQGKKSLQIATDSLLLYFKSEKSTFYNIEVDIGETRKGYWRRIDDSAGVRKPPQRTIFGKTYHPPAGKHFKFSQEKINLMCEENKIQINSRGRPEYWVEPSDTKPLTSNWTDISGYSFTTGYPTENSEVLLERVINLCSSKGDIVLDCFAGSGTTAAVAEKLGRRWITADLGRFAIHTTRKRLLGIPDVKPFVVQNLGKYERQQWMKAEFKNGETRSTQEKEYRNFIVGLYDGEPLSGHMWLHGVKGGRMIHIGSVDSPVADGDVKAIVQEFWKVVGKESKLKTNGIDILGWDFAFEINRLTKDFEKTSNVNISFKKIPREVLEKRAVEQGDIHFFELGSVDVDVKTSKMTATVSLKDFMIPLDDVPEEARKSITHWSQFIDYWAIDWDYKDDTFHNVWQSYRTKKDMKLELKASHEYEEKGEYEIVIKVIDILGNDSTKAVKINI